jgi:glyoxylase-like metal-dependent hydrolase (beta-lactamase superfamily II)
MHEIAENIYYDTSYAGVTLGAINWPHGLILLDSPFRLEDGRAWRSAFQNLGGGVERLLVQLDAHPDRTLGARSMDCTIIGHDKMAGVFRSRPLTFKSQGGISGADWEAYNGLGNIRWAPPDITFSERMEIYWNTNPLVLEYHPGSATGSTWAILPEEKVIFAGDAVLANQPPFLANADLPAWRESLGLLLSPQYHGYIVVSGRGGPVTPAQIRVQMAYLEKAQMLLDDLAEQKAAPEETDRLVDALMEGIPGLGGRTEQYQQRLSFGLRQYYLRHYRPGSSEIIEE